MSSQAGKGDKRRPTNWSAWYESPLWDKSNAPHISTEAPDKAGVGSDDAGWDNSRTAESTSHVGSEGLTDTPCK